jgi:hypothetical protein
MYRERLYLTQHRLLRSEFFQLHNFNSSNNRRKKQDIKEVKKK